MLYKSINYPPQFESEYNSLQEFQAEQAISVQCFGCIESRPDQDTLTEYKKYLESIANSMRRRFADQKVFILVTGSADNGVESTESASYLSTFLNSNPNVLVVPVFVSSFNGMDYLDNLRAGLDIADFVKVDLIESWTDQVRIFKHRMCLIALGQNPRLTRWVNRLEPNNPNQNTWKQTCHGLQLAVRELRK